MRSKTNSKAPATVDEYLAALPKDQRAALENVRKIIIARAPEVEQRLSYHIPAFFLKGKVLIYMGAATGHCAIYGVGSGYEDELKDYETSGKGTLRFQPDHPLPTALLKRIVNDRIEKISAPRAAKKVAAPDSRAAAKPKRKG